MALFPQRVIDDLRLQADIVQVVQDYVPLKRSGATFKGLCPFHAEKTPSFHVNRDKGFFHCFGCGTGGDVFKFLELHEKVAFPEAVRMLAQKVGVALPEAEEADSDEARASTSQREALLKIHELAAAHFRQALEGQGPGAARARAHLRERGVAPATSEALGLGYASGVRAPLRARLSAEGFPEALLVQSGLIVRRENGELIDRFRNRLMIPICRDTGSVVAFGGRALDPDQNPKYLNSPETAIYSKGRTLYGLHLTKSAIRKVGFVVLVEGYFDFAQVFQTDAAPVVASCGTALTVPQARVLRRFTSKVVLSYDPDSAGQGATARSCELLVAEGFEVNVVVLDTDEDPDTFIRRQGAERYRERLRSSRPYLDYLLEQASAGLDLGQDEHRRELLDKMLAVAARIPDLAARDQFADRIAHRAGITEEVVRAQIRKAAARGQTRLTEHELPALGDIKHAEKGLIWGLVHDTDSAMAALRELEESDFEGLAGREIFQLARSLDAGPPNLLPSTLFERLSTMNAQLVASIAASTDPPALPGDCARTLKRLRWERERAGIQREIDRLQKLGAQQHGEEIEALWERKKALLHRLEELT